jgi:hypothetical protein
MQAMRSTQAGVDTPELKLASDALALAPLDAWINWEALPLDVQGETLVLALEDPRRGFVIKEIERHTNCRVKPVFAGVPSAEIVKILRRS